MCGGVLLMLLRRSDIQGSLTLIDGDWPSLGWSLRMKFIIIAPGLAVQAGARLWRRACVRTSAAESTISPSLESSRLSCGQLLARLHDRRGVRAGGDS